METRFKYEDTNLRVVTQQHNVTLCIAIYNNDTGSFLAQFFINEDEEHFHKILREKYKDNLIND